MIQNSANVDYYPTNTKSLNNIPKVTWSEYGYDSENHTVVDNFIKDFKFDNWARATIFLKPINGRPFM